MRTRRSVAAVVACALLLAATCAVAIPAVTNAPAAGAENATNTDPDYATVQYSDPWDFSNGADFYPGQAQNLSSINMANGELDMTANPGGGLVLAESIAGTIPANRTTSLHPINANQLRKVSFRMWADHGGAGGFYWYTCDHIIPSCENGFAFLVQPGWNTYTFDIPSQAPFRGGPAWQGTILGLRLVPSGSSVIRIGLDWVRLVPSSASSTPPASPVPLPVVDNPSIAGGYDFASIVRHDPWDMSQPSDIGAPANMAYNFTGTLLSGVNTGPNPGDPSFYLPLAGPIDGNRFHRLTFNVFYDGPHGQGFGPGGGMVARVIWETAGAPGVWQDSEDIIVYPGWNDISVDLATSPPSAIVDPDDGARRIGWAGQQITALRFDPDEDIGVRHFLVDNIKVAEDSTGYGGSYPIQFHDNAWAPGTTADLYVTDSRGSFGGTRIASGLPVQSGTNTFVWNPSPFVPQTVWVYVVLHRGGDTARAYATGPLRMTSAPSPAYGVDPFGSFDSARQVPGGVRVRGWAVDPDTTGPIPVHFWVDNQAPVGATTADTARADIAQAVNGFGPDHGFDATVKVPPGRHAICAWGINTGSGTNRVLGCRIVTVSTNPIGSLDVVRTTSGGVTISGWALDPNTGGPITVHLYSANGGFWTVRANKPRADIGAAYPGYGSAHGFSRTIPRAGSARSICAYGINRMAGANALLGCKTG